MASFPKSFHWGMLKGEKRVSVGAVQCTRQQAAKYILTGASRNSEPLRAVIASADPELETPMS